MGVYIKGIAMPKSCWACACYHHKVDDGYYDYDVCQASGTVFNDGYSSATGNKTHIDPFKQRLDNCPLAHVPPHGRLIDADAFENFIRKDWDKNDHWIADVVYSRPTIIPADPAEEGE